MPGRCEPGTGEIHYPAVAKALADIGYTGTVGMEAYAAGRQCRRTGGVPRRVHRLTRRAGVPACGARVVAGHAAGGGILCTLAPGWTDNAAMANEPFPDPHWGREGISPLFKLAYAFASTTPGSWCIRRLVPLDHRLMKRTNGRYTLFGPTSLPQLLLTTIGRKSGQTAHEPTVVSARR